MTSIKKFVIALKNNEKFVSNVIPILFKRVHKENSRGGKLGMEVGKGREKVLISLFKEIIGENYICDDIVDTKPEVDCILTYDNHEEMLSIKTFCTTPNIKLCWTADKDCGKKFIDNYEPKAHMLIVSIPKHNRKNMWNNKKGFLYIIPLSVQIEIWKKFGTEYMKIPKKGTNSRGISLNNIAYYQMIEHLDTYKLPIIWNGNRIDDLYNPEERWRNMIKFLKFNL